MLVSIITPCLNSRKTIRDTIESVLKQSYKNIEYIIVDGGSTDGTLEIMKAYLPKFHGRMRIVSEKDKGVYDAMNKGIRLSHGHLIGIINSDDFYELNAVETAVLHMRNSKYQVLYGYCRLIENDQIKAVMKSTHKNLKNSMIPHPTCFVTRDIYSDLGMFLTRYKIANDYELMVRLYTSGKVKFIQIKQVMANFRLGGLSSDGKRAGREKALITYHYGLITFKTMLNEFVSNMR